MVALDSRAGAIASFVRKGSSVADIGADHALIPIYLIERAICPRALASDINEGPAERARDNIKRHSLSDRISVRVADGLDGIEEFSPDDIIIAGMGGELIASILSRSEYVKKQEISLILQPMTKAAFLREYLYSSGFDITGESLVKSGGKIYQIIAAEYDGIKRSAFPAELLLGKINISERSPLFIEFAKSRLSALEKRRNGMKRAALATGEEDEIVEQIKELLKNETVETLRNT